MDEYITKQAAIEAFTPQCGDWSEAWSAEEIKAKLEAVPPADVVPWSFLERYADWFCASVQYPKFIGEAKRFYLDSIGAMERGNIDG